MKLKKKVTDHNRDKYITTPEFNNLGAGVFAARSAKANLITKTDFDTKHISLNKKINSNKTKHLLAENEFKKLKTFDSIYFRDKIIFIFIILFIYLFIILFIIIFIFETLKECLMKILRLLLLLIIALIQNYAILVLKQE